MYATSDSGLVHHSTTLKSMSPSHPTGVGRPNGARHLVDLSSGSTCCSSSTSSSPHTLLQGPPPVPNLPTSLTQGVMLFAPGELSGATAGDSSSSPSAHYGQQAQYGTHQFHPYLNSNHSATLPRHYDPTLYSDDQLMVSLRTASHSRPTNAFP